MKHLISFKIPLFSSRKTIKEFLKSFHVGRGKIEEIRVLNEIYLNQNKVNLDAYLEGGDLLSFLNEEEEIKQFSEKEIEVLYEDDGLIAVNKPFNLLVHSDGIEKDTLLNRVAYYLYKKNEPPLIYPLHRLDKETTGVILFAKDFFHGNMMDDLFLNQKITRIYRAVCEGYIKDNEGVLHFHIGRNRHSSQKMIISSTGEEIITYYKVLKRAQNKTYLELELKTGKRHQIRLSLSFIGHPILGDTLYGNKFSKDNLHLEASRFVFIHPLTSEKISIEAPLRKELSFDK